MRRKLVILFVMAGEMAFSTTAFAISRGGRVVGSGIIGGPQNGAARNHGVPGAAPFSRNGGMGGRLTGGPHVGGAGIPPKK